MTPAENGAAAPDAGETPEENLTKREQLLILAQRRLDARSLLQKKALPEELMGLLDFTDDQQMHDSLKLAEKLLRGAQSPAEAPKAAGFTAGRDQGYAQRAALYLADRASYQQQFGGE
ncbi:MAG: hypothetical protein AB9880_08350 [Christensenellales bacterium]